jgi:two-component system chemotaxis response regulator CheB
VTTRLTVLVVDDSAIVRETMRDLLARHGMVVTVAADAIIAAGKMRGARFDALVLDLEMPRMDGLTFLAEIARHADPPPVVVCSSCSNDAAMTALARGAVEVVAKPKVGVRDFLNESEIVLIDAIRAAAASRRRVATVDLERSRAAPASASGLSADGRTGIVAIGASTGGTEAILAILERLPPDSPGVVVVQHMPAGFTAAFARRLDRACAVEVREAQDGDAVKPGLALIAAGDRHLSVVRAGIGYAVTSTAGALVSRHRPSVDVLFASVAIAAGADAIGVILTGMGSDGAAGLLAMRQAGARTFAQDEASSVVFGMPKEAIARGGASCVLPLSEMASAILGGEPPSRGGT